MRTARIGAWAGKYLAAFLALFFFGLPLLWVVLTALKPTPLITTKPPVWFFTPTLDHFKTIFLDKNIHIPLFNSFMISLGTTVLSLAVGAPAAYALARFRMKKKQQLAFWFLTARMTPPVVAAIPLYLTFRFLHLLDTHFGMILVYLTFSFPFAVWMLRGFFEDLPLEVEEAALIDGCSPFRTFRTIALPLIAPGLAATAILCFIFAWNEFLFAIIFTGYSAKTLPVAALSFMTDRMVLWGELSASAIVIFLPVAIFAVVVRKYLLKGLTMGSIK